MFIVPQDATTPLPSAQKGRKWLAVGGGIAVLAVIVAVILLRSRASQDGYISQGAVSTPRTQGTAASTKASSVVQAQPAPVFAADADGDGLSDADEQKYGTDPKKSDTDTDGASDSEEIFARKTDPLKADTVPVHPGLLPSSPSIARP